MLALLGLKVAARLEWLIVVFQYFVLLLVALVGINVLRHGTAAVAFSWSRFTLTSMGGMRGLMCGMLIACFMYSHWGAAIYVNEESADRVDSPGEAAIASVVILAIFYVISIFGFQAVLAPQQLQQHAGDALAVISAPLLPGPWSTNMSLVVLTGTLATLQAGVISAARVSCAMSRDRVMPAIFPRVDRRIGNPWAATLVTSLFNLALLGLALATDSIGHALGNIFCSLGLMSILYYSLTGTAAVWQHCRSLMRSPADFTYGGLLPGFGALCMVWVAIESALIGATSTMILTYGVDSVALGALVAMCLRYFGGAPFFRSGHYSAIGLTVSKEQSL